MKKQNKVKQYLYFSWRLYCPLYGVFILLYLVYLNHHSQSFRSLCLLNLLSGKKREPVFVNTIKYVVSGKNLGLQHTVLSELMWTFVPQIHSCSVSLFSFAAQIRSLPTWNCRWYAVGKNSIDSVNYDHWYINGCSTRPNSYGCSSDLFASMACCVFACRCFSCFCPGMYFQF